MRGSCPSPADSHRRYGGNTACVLVEADGEPSIVLDLGTGLRGLSGHLAGSTFQGHAFVTHLHWDHVQGLPFFADIDRPGATLDIHGPPQEEGSLQEAFEGLVRPPYFPVRISELRGRVRFHEVVDEVVSVGSAKVTVRPVPHRGPTTGYRVECGGRSVVYVSDHQAPPGCDRVAESVLDLCQGADLLIHDAQYNRAEFALKQDWGHSTPEYAVLVGRRAGVRRLALFHHDPGHDDREVDRLLADARRFAEGSGIEEVVAAVEGSSIELGGR